MIHQKLMHKPTVLPPRPAVLIKGSIGHISSAGSFTTKLKGSLV